MLRIIFLNCELYRIVHKNAYDRSHRAVIGHSMGGIMFFLAGKYPDMIGAAYNSKGSQSSLLVILLKHSLYQVRYMFKNLYGVRLAFCEQSNGEYII